MLLELNFPENLFCIALLYATQLEPKTKVQVEGMARAQTGDNLLTQNAFEEVFLRFKSDDETAENVNVLEKDESEEKVNRVKNRNQWKPGRPGQRGRSRGNQRGYNTEPSRGRGNDRKCYTCDREEHVTRFCLIKQKFVRSQRSEATFTGVISNYHQQINNSNETDKSIFTMTHAERTKEDNATSNRNLIDVILESGATKSVIGEDNLAEIQKQQNNEAQWEMK